MRPELSWSSRPTGERRRGDATSSTTVRCPPGSRAVDTTPTGLLSAHTSRGSGPTRVPSISTPLCSSTSRAGSVTRSPATLTRPAAISFSAARRDATPEWARYFPSRMRITVPHWSRGPESPARRARRRGRADLPHGPDLGVDRAGGTLLRSDDEPAGRTALAARGRGAAVLARVRTGRARTRRNRESALQHRRRPADRSGADALSRRAPLAVPVVAVGLSAHLHVLRDGADEVRPQPHSIRDPRPGAALPPRRAGRPRRLHGHGRAAAQPRQRARGVRPAAGPRDHVATHGDLHGRLDPWDRATGERGAARAARAVAPRGRRGAQVRADAGERPLPAAGCAGRVPAVVRAPPPAGLRRVPDARRRERPLRAGRGARARAAAGRLVQGEPDPVQPDGRRLQRLEPGRDRRFPRGARGARRASARAAHAGPRH